MNGVLSWKVQYTHKQNTSMIAFTQKKESKGLRRLSNIIQKKIKN